VILPLTLSMASAATLLNVWLAGRVSRIRRARRISIGDGGDESLIARMRAQANYVEHAPFFLILLAGVEIARGSPLWLWALACLFIVARILHALGMDGGARKKLRTIGMMTTMAVLLAMIVYAIFIVATAKKPESAIIYAAAGQAPARI
jgi:uncharacterized membrane protein YecN with MAPEG domain